MVGSLDNAENAKRNFFLTTLYLLTTWYPVRQFGEKRTCFSYTSFLRFFSLFIDPFFRQLCHLTFKECKVTILWKSWSGT